MFERYKAVLDKAFGTQFDSSPTERIVIRSRSQDTNRNTSIPQKLVLEGNLDETVQVNRDESKREHILSVDLLADESNNVVTEVHLALAARLVLRVC